MNAITTLGTQATMTSREIAELTGKQHKDVLYDIRKMLDDLKLTSADFSADLLDAYNRAQPGFKLPKRESLILVSGYSVTMRAKIIDRWQELEHQVAAPAFKLPDFTNPALAARAWADQVEQAQTLKIEMAAKQKQLEVAAPKAEALDRIATADGMFNLQNAGKMLQQKPNKFIQKLRESHWIFKRPGAKYNSAHVEKINAGYLTTKAHEYEHPDGTTRVNEQVMVTPKGLAKLALMLGTASPPGLLIG